MNSVATVAFMCFMIFLACHTTILSHGTGQRIELQKRQDPFDYNIKEQTHIWSEHIISSEAPVQFCAICGTNDVSKFEYIIDDLHDALDDSEHLFRLMLNNAGHKYEYILKEILYDDIQTLNDNFECILKDLLATIENLNVDSCPILINLTNSIYNCNSAVFILYSFSFQGKVMELPDLLKLFTHLIYNLMEVFQTTEYMRLCLAREMTVNQAPAWKLMDHSSYVKTLEFRKSIVRMSYLIYDIKALQTSSNDDAISVLEIIACGILRIHNDKLPPQCDESREPPIKHTWKPVL